MDRNDVKLLETSIAFKNNSMHKFMMIKYEDNCNQWVNDIINKITIIGRYEFRW